MIPGTAPLAAAIPVNIVDAVALNGSGNYLQRANIVGVSDGKRGTVSLWIRRTLSGKSEVLFNTATSTSFGLYVLFDGSDVCSAGGSQGNNAPVFHLGGSGSTRTVTPADGWTHILASWDVAISAAHLWIQDANADLAPIVYSTNDIKYDGGNVGLGAYNTGLGFFTGDMAEVWISFTDYFDLTIAANRRKFIRGGGKPQFLGANGERPSGTSPAIYMKGPASVFPGNLGTGGAFNVHGTLNDAATSPSD